MTNQSGTQVEPARVLAIASGKGGVGKTNIVSNLAIAFSRAGKRVLAMDGDLGLANLDIAFGPVSYTHLRAQRDQRGSRMPSSA